MGEIYIQIIIVHWILAPAKAATFLAVFFNGDICELENPEGWRKSLLLINVSFCYVRTTLERHPWAVGCWPRRGLRGSVSLSSEWAVGWGWNRRMEEGQTWRNILYARWSWFGLVDTGFQTSQPSVCTVWIENSCCLIVSFICTAILEGTMSETLLCWPV